MFFSRLFRKKPRSKREEMIETLILKTTGIRPSNLDLYSTALRHKSAARNIHGKPESSNERLEFLGDTIIDAVVAEYLFDRYPKAEEGELTKMKSRIVSRSNLNHIALSANLHSMIETDSQAHNARESLGGNALEAVVGALYLDRGFNVAKAAVIGMLESHTDLKKLEYQEADFKSRLYELAHQKKQELRFDTRPASELNGRKLFVSKAFMGALLVGTGEGMSKKKAEQQAAQQALKKLNALKE